MLAMAKISFTVSVILGFIVLSTFGSKYEKKCVHLRYPDFKLTFTKKMQARNCMVCNRLFNIQFMTLIPYSEVNNEANDLIQDVIKSCCSRCPKFRTRISFYENQLNPKILRSSLSHKDIVYPVFAYSKSVEVYGGYFIPFYDPSGSIYVTTRQEFSLVRLIVSCAKLWPVMLVGAAMVIVAGFFGWLLDFWKNTEEFPKNFIRGWWEGIWWSFVTMTTVGYGDKSPRSVPARLFAIVWIYAGIVVCGILTASLTTIIMEGSTDKTPSMAGNKIGMLSNRIYDANIIAANGGSIKPAIWCRKEELSIFHLLQRLKDGEIDGFLLDKLTYWKWKTMLNTYSRKQNGTTCDQIREKLNRRRNKLFRACSPLRYKQCRQVLLDYFQHWTMVQDIPQSGDETAYGIWLKHRSYYEFFKNAFFNNKLTFKSNLASEYANQTRETEKDFTMKVYADISHYHHVFGILGSMLLMIVLFGVCFEVIRRRGSNENEENKATKNDAKLKKYLEGSYLLWWEPNADCLLKEKMLEY